MTMILTGSGTGTVGVPNSGTAQNSTSGTAITFTGIPAGIKRVTVMFNGVSTNGTSKILVQLGASGAVETTSYVSSSIEFGASSGSTTNSTAGFVMNIQTASDVVGGIMTIATLGSNIWASTHIATRVSTNGTIYGAGTKTTAAALDRVRITTVNGTDTFDAGSINILYE